MPVQIAANEFYDYTRCSRIVFLDRYGDRSRRLPPSAYDRLLMRQGNEHEAAIMAGITHSRPAFTYTDLPAGFRETLDLMRRGVPVIGQGVLMHGELVGIPDVLLRVEGESLLGDHHYRPVDIKLATRPADGYQLQVMTYVALLERIQGVRPQGALWLRLPAEERQTEHDYHEVAVPFDEERFSAYLEQLRAVALGVEPPAFYSSTCSGCGWREVCVPAIRAAQDVSLIPGMLREVWQELHRRGLGRLGALAEADENSLLDIRGVGAKRAASYLAHARAMVEGRAIPIGPIRLPAGDPEVFFDAESVPIADTIYLFGALIRRGRQVSFEYSLAEHPEDEPLMWEQFLALMDRLGGVAYHYGQYERTAIDRLQRKYGEDPRAAALLDRMVDLEKALKQSMALPLTGYSLKSVAPWLGFTWTGEINQGDDSMVVYYRWLEDGNRTHLAQIVRYNEEDCRATLHIKDWLAAQGGNGARA
ncbi:MAG: hypothetical protein Kow00124_31220 [Anaerolineae bacterium]